MTRPRRYGRPIKAPEGWQDWTQEQRDEWFRRVLDGTEPYEVLGNRTGRPDPRTWHGDFVALRVRVVCQACGAVVATVEDYEGGALWHYAGERWVSAHPPPSCRRHGPLRIVRDRVQDCLEQARDDAAVVKVRAAPRNAC